VTRWQRRVRGLLAVATMAFAVTVYFAIRERPRPPAPPADERRDPRAALESTGATLVQMLGDTERFEVEAARQFLYEDGRVRLEDGVRVRLPSSDRREVRVTAARAEVRDQRSLVVLEGDVRLVSSDGARVETERAVYDHRTGLVEIPGPASFVQGRSTARGVGATYDRLRDVFWIRHRATLEIRHDARDQVTRITAARATYARGDQYWRFEGDAVLVRGPLTSHAEEATLHLGPDAERIRTIELRGGARVDLQEAAASIERMTAREITLDYSDTGTAPQRARLAGGAVVDMRDRQQGRRRIAAEWLDLQFAQGGRVDRLEARDRVEVQMPAAGETPARRIRAHALDLAGGADTQPSTARFSGQVDWRESVRSASSGVPAERLARADTVEAIFAPGVGDPTEARFIGNVLIRDGDLEARAGEAWYRTTAALLRLEPGGSSGGDPRVTDSRVVVDARQIEVLLASRRLVAETNVRSQFLPPPSGREASTAAPRRVPRLIRQDRPWYATADRLVYDGGTGHAELTGAVKLFQDDTTIQAQQVILDEARGDLEAIGEARSRVLLEGTDEKTGAPERVPTVGTADRIRYDDRLQRITYLHRARLIGQEGVLSADRIDVYLDETAQALDRLDAVGAVTVQLDGRVAGGDRLRYEAARGRYVVVGTPVSIVEDLGAQCRETRGRTLTFFRSIDTIDVDGNAEHRTRTKTGGKCPALPLQ
jgi:LPS export ABC transporter protein LptC